MKYIIIAILVTACAPKTWMKEPAEGEHFRFKRTTRHEFQAPEYGYTFHVDACSAHRRIPARGWAYISPDLFLVLSDAGPSEKAWGFTRCRLTHWHPTEEKLANPIPRQPFPRPPHDWMRRKW